MLEINEFTIKRYAQIHNLSLTESKNALHRKARAERIAQLKVELNNAMFKSEIKDVLAKVLDEL